MDCKNYFLMNNNYVIGQNQNTGFIHFNDNYQQRADIKNILRNM